MTVFFVVSAACILLGTLIGFPQAIRLMREKSSAGLSQRAWQMWLAVSAAWVFHGSLGGNIAQIIPNVVGVATCFAILRLTRQDRGLSWANSYSLAAALLLLAVAVRLIWGPVAYGAFMVLPQGIATIGQFLEMARSRDISGVSPGYLVLATLLQGSWVLYGLLLPDRAAVVTSSVVVILCAVNLAWWLARKAGLVPVIWPLDEADVVGNALAVS